MDSGHAFELGIRCTSLQCNNKNLRTGTNHSAQLSQCVCYCCQAHMLSFDRYHGHRVSEPQLYVLQTLDIAVKVCSWMEQELGINVNDCINPAQTTHDNVCYPHTASATRFVRSVTTSITCEPCQLQLLCVETSRCFQVRSLMESESCFSFVE